MYSVRELAAKVCRTQESSLETRRPATLTRVFFSNYPRLFSARPSRVVALRHICVFSWIVGVWNGLSVFSEYLKVGNSPLLSEPLHSIVSMGIRLEYVSKRVDCVTGLNCVSFNICVLFS